MVASRRQVELLEKNRPRQERAKRTYEAILTAAAELLVEVGVERISTNLVADRAGITVPALYRYFPNKYAVLNALGSGLMDRQNAVFRKWVEEFLVDNDPVSLLNNVSEVLRRTYEVTREQTGGLEIVQALRAVAPLREVRLGSHHVVADAFATMLETILGRPPKKSVTVHARLTVEAAYTSVEMALEDEMLKPAELFKESERIIRLYWLDLLPEL